MDAIYPTKDGVCCKCSTALKGKQKRWCSKQCVNAAFDDVMLRRGNSTYMRKALLLRDKEVCAECGLDTAKLKRILRHAENSIRDSRLFAYFDNPIKALLGFSCWSHLWEADHIVEVAAGGEHSLGNLQTLCIRCHKAKTKRFVSRTAGTILAALLGAGFWAVKQ